MLARKKTLLKLLFVILIALPVLGWSQTDIARNKPAVSSSNESSTYNASKAFDGNGTTRWSSNFSDPQWIYVDLGARYTITGVSLVWEAAASKEYRIQISDTPSNWNTVYTTTNGNGGTDTHTLSETGRYVRMKGFTRTTQYGHSLYTMKVFGTPVVVYTVTPSVVGFGSISPQTPVQVDQGGSANFNFSANTGNRLQNVLVNNVSVGTPSSYTITNIQKNTTIDAVYVADTYSITATGGNSTTGTITPSGITTVMYGGSQEYTILPKVGYQIKAITVDGTSVAVGNKLGTNYLFSNVDKNHTIAVDFELRSYTVNVNVVRPEGGVVSKTGPQQVMHGSSLNLSITKNAGWSGTVQIDDGIPQSSFPSSYVLPNVTKDTELNIVFTQNQYTVTVNVNPGGAVDKPGANTVMGGDDFIFNTLPAVGYELDRVEYGNQVRNSSPVTIPKVTLNHVVSVFFKLKTYALTIPVSANGSIQIVQGANTIDPSAVPHGAVVTLKTTPSVGNTLDYIRGNGVNLTPVDSKISNDVAKNWVTAQITSDVNVTAVFSVKQFVVNATVSKDAQNVTGGAVSPASVSVNYGNKATIALTPDPGYEPATVEYLSALTPDVRTLDPAAQSYVSDGVFKATDLEFTFKRKTYSITSGVLLNGKIEIPLNKQEVLHGESVTFDVTPNAGYQIVSVKANAVELNPGTPRRTKTAYTVSNITENTIVTATVEAILYTINAVSLTSNGLITPATQQLQENTTGEITIAPSVDYEPYQVIIDYQDGSTVTEMLSNATVKYTTKAAKQNATYSFNFRGVERTVIVAIDGNVGGVVAGIEQGRPRHNTPKVYKAYPAVGWHVEKVQYDNNDLVSIGEDEYRIVPIEDGKVLNVFFSRDVYSVPTPTAGVNGQFVSGPSTVEYGKKIAITVKPATGYVLSKMTYTGNTAGTVTCSAPSTITGEQDCVSPFITQSPGAIALQFDVGVVTLSAYSENVLLGTVTPEYSNKEFAFNTPLTFTVQAVEEGYEIDKVVYGGDEKLPTTSGGSQYEMNADKMQGSVIASFKLKQYAINFDDMENGSVAGVTVGTPVDADWGSDKSFTVVPITDYVVHRFIVSKNGVESDLEPVVKDGLVYIIEDVTANVYVQVLFKQKPCDGEVEINGDIFVDGNIHATGYIQADYLVATPGWEIVDEIPDYVFEPDYHLKTLEQVEQYVKEHKHLEGVPSAEDVGNDGMDLIQMNIKLLEKIEEMTLYAIELNKQHKLHEKSIEDLKTQCVE